MKILDARETNSALPYSALVCQIGEAARQLAERKIIAPARLVLDFESKNSLLCMPAVAQDIGIVKLATFHAENARSGLPTIRGDLIVFDSVTGERLLLLDGPAATARRTAAVTLLGIQTLAGSPPQSALLIGTGVQARAHAEALIAYFGTSKFWVSGTTGDRSRAFIDHLMRDFPMVTGVPVVTAELRPEGVGSDVVIALTTSTTPVVPAKLPKGTFAVGVGAFRSDMVELPRELLLNRRIVVDYLPGALLEAGDLLTGKIDWSQVQEIGDLLDLDNEREKYSFVFKTVGHACWDLAAARVALTTLRLRK